jgi:hypothetical protein
METKRLRLESIRIDGGTQMRDKIENEVVEEYIATAEEGTKFPPLEVVFDGEVYWLWDGFHRYEMYKRCGEQEVECNVVEGTVREAILRAIGANQQRGLKRNSATMEIAVMRLLEDPEWGKWSPYRIAEVAGVTRWFVRSVLSRRNRLDRKGYHHPIPPGVTPHQYHKDLTPHKDYPCYDPDRGEWYRVPGMVIEGATEEKRVYVGADSAESGHPVPPVRQINKILVKRGDQEYTMRPPQRKKKEEVPLLVIENNSTKPLSAKALEAVLSDWLSEEWNDNPVNLTALIEGQDLQVENVKTYLSATRKVVFGWPDVIQAATELRKQYTDRPPTDEEEREGQPDPILEVLGIPLEEVHSSIINLVQWLNRQKEHAAATNLETTFGRARYLLLQKLGDLVDKADDWGKPEEDPGKEENNILDDFPETKGA